MSSAIILLRQILLSDEGYVIDFGTMPLQLLFHAVMVLLLFFLMGKLLIKPIQKALEKRQQTIQQSISNAEESEKQAAALKADYEQKLMEAGKERDEILQKAYDSAKQKEAQVLKEAREEAGRIRERAERDIEQERAKAKDEIQQESVSLAAAMTEKLLEQYVDENVRAKMVEDAVSGMENAQWLK